ncbi:MAG: hypothetical protein J6U45_03460, partial [Alistipes sp.]|nr:hypothetical protein [Alistipes sp.]
CLHTLPSREEENYVKAKFAGSPLVVGKTDAEALLLRERSPFLNPPPARRPLSTNFRSAEKLTHGNMGLKFCYTIAQLQ